LVRALGGGLDEEILKAVSEDTFRPAEREGHPIAAGLDIILKIGAAQ
jgi:hypothetical protein